MKVIHKPRGGGKTIELIKMADNYNGYIVCASIEEARRIYDIATIKKYKINLPITFNEFTEGRYGSGCKHFYIDNADSLLQSMSRLEIKAITTTVEWEEHPVVDITNDEYCKSFFKRIKETKED